MKQTAPRTVEFACGVCSVSRLVLNDVDVTAVSGTERWDAIEKLLPRHKWAVLLNVAGDRHCVCPHCVKAVEQAEHGPLPRFDRLAKCPKCGHGDLPRQFCNGLVFGCTMPAYREHLHRTCPACGYDLIQACLDDKVTK